MAKKKAQPPELVTAPEAPKVPFLKWPEHVTDLKEKPRLFRIHRVNSFEWQGYVTEDGVEKPIGKPDLFELVEFKIKSIMRLEGQKEFIAEKKKRSDAQEAAHDQRLKASQDAKQA